MNAPADDSVIRVGRARRVCEADAVRQLGFVECTADCGYVGQALYVGADMHAINEVRLCGACGDFTTVLDARVGATGIEPASGRGRP